VARIAPSFFQPTDPSILWSAKCPDSPSSLSDADNATSLLVKSGAWLRFPLTALFTASLPHVVGSS